MGLDPGLRLATGRGISSFLWPQEGAEDMLLAYLPAQSILHALHQCILPLDIYWVRFPWAVYLLAGALVLLIVLRTKNFSLLFSLILLIVVLNEKSLFETTRGVRIEPFTFLIIVLGIYAKQQKHVLLQSGMASILVFTHPNVWPIALVLFLDAVVYQYRATHINIRTIFTATIPLLFLLAFAVFIDFRFTDFISQFVHQGADHAVAGNLVDRFIAHFISRFWPYYSTQPWIPLLIYSALFYAIYQVVKRKSNYLSWSVLLTHLVWFAILGPFPRYNSILVILSVCILAEPLYTMYIAKGNKALLVCTGLCLLSMADVAGRHAMASIQAEERDPYPVLSWLANELPLEESFLITGSEIAYYAVAKNPKAGYFLYNMPPYKYSFEKYDKYLLLLDKQLATCIPLAEYRVPTSDLSQKIGRKTYRSLYLQQCPNREIYKTILHQLDEENRKEVAER